MDNITNQIQGDKTSFLVSTDDIIKLTKLPRYKVYRALALENAPKPVNDQKHYRLYYRDDVVTYVLQNAV